MSKFSAKTTPNLTCAKKPSKTNERELVKTSMKICMGVAVVSGFMSGNVAKKIHVISGVALVGLSIYHNFLYEK